MVEVSGVWCLATYNNSKAFCSSAVILSGVKRSRTDCKEFMNAIKN